MNPYACRTLFIGVNYTTQANEIAVFQLILLLQK